MSRIGKLPVAVAEDVNVTLEEEAITIKGKLGELTTNLPKDVIVTFNDGEILVKPANKSRKSRSLWGLIRSLIANMVQGVTEGFEIELEIKGVGYRASVSGNMLNLSLGFSHDVMFAIPEGIEIKCQKQTILIISGANKQQVGQVAAEIRSLRPPEPYKGKGIIRKGEYVIRKEGKKK